MVNTEHPATRQRMQFLLTHHKSHCTINQFAEMLQLEEITEEEFEDTEYMGDRLDVLAEYTQE